MAEVKDFAAKDLAPSCNSPPLTPELKENNYVKFDGDLRVKFGFTLSSPVRRLKSWIAKVFA